MAEILTNAQINELQDDNIKQLFRCFNKNMSQIPYNLLRDMKLTKTSYNEQFIELYNIYKNAEKKKWHIANSNGLKKIMVQHGITRIKCFGCDREFDFNELDSLILIKIYKNIADYFPTYVCCNECTPHCPTINIRADEARRIQVSRRGNVQMAILEEQASIALVNEIRNDIAIIQDEKKKLEEEYESLLKKINEHNIMLEKIKDKDVILEAEIQKQANILKLINDTELQTNNLNEKYDTLFKSNVELANQISTLKGTMQNISTDSATSLTKFEEDFKIITTNLMNKMFDDLYKNTSVVKNNLENIELTSDNIVDKLKYVHKCDVCADKKDPMWAYTCGHTFCETCIKKSSTCPTCRAVAQKIRLFL